MQEETARRIGIFGGSFSPPHLGHLRAARFFGQTLRLDRLLIVPAGAPPLKSPCGVSGEDRLALCRLTFPFEISDAEVRRGGVSYTIDTLREVRAGHPCAQLYLLIGTDQLAAFPLWRDWRGILELCTVCALQRDAAPLRTDLPIRVLEGFVPVEISSTRLRRRLLLGEDCAAWLAPGALAYIHEKRLYQPLPPERIHHSRCVAQAAQALALQYGADPAKAYEAGLLHDCAKYLPFEEQERLCARHGRPLTPDERAAPPVCHAFAGAAYAALELGVTDGEVLAAMRWHTTGHAGMTPLEEVVFVADLVSADRDYPDVERVRALAGKDLHAASRYILEYIFARLKARGEPAHPDSLAWYDELTMNNEQLGGRYATTGTRKGPRANPGRQKGPGHRGDPHHGADDPV